MNPIFAQHSNETSVNLCSICGDVYTSSLSDQKDCGYHTPPQSPKPLKCPGAPKKSRRHRSRRRRRKLTVIPESPDE